MPTAQTQTQLLQSSESDIECDNLKLIKKISNSRFPIYTAYNASTGSYVALKIFKEEGERIENFFNNEARGFFLSHPNVISIVDAVRGQQLSNNDEVCNVSYIVMEHALCDFLSMIEFSEFTYDEKFVRTYFRQLVEGLKYLHSQGVYHMDLKHENLLLGQDYKLKICDFDVSYSTKDSKMMGDGTLGYRAPEVKEGKCERPDLSDIYSLGIVLFGMRMGHLPFTENPGCEIYTSLKEKPEDFWSFHQKSIKSNISDGFKEVFAMMVKSVPKERASILAIKKTSWYNGPVYSANESKAMMSKILGNKAKLL
jgi:serine/threonine protein kinase